MAAAVLALQGEAQGEPTTMVLSEFYVDSTNGDDANTGDSADNAIKTINKAVSLVQLNGTIYLTGTYSLENIYIAGNFTIKPAASFSGSNLIEVTGGVVDLDSITIDGTSKTGISNLINVKDGASLTLKSINIKNGTGQHAMYISGKRANAKTTATFEGGEIKNNEAAYGTG